MTIASTQRALQVQPNVTPMIDVMLVLLIVFMVSAPLLMAGVPAVPPYAEHLTAHPDDPADFTIGIDASGRLYMHKAVVSPQNMESRLAALLATTSADRVVYIRADQAVDYRAVQDAMEMAYRAGARVVGLIGERPVAGRR